MEPAPIFIGGINRTGTSLARRLLGSHPLVAMPPSELEFFKHVRVPLTRDLGRDGALALAAEVLAWPKVAGWALDTGDVESRVAGGDHDARAVFVAILSSFAARAGKPRWGEKTTGYERHLKTLQHWFGDAFAFVHMIRHPVSAYASALWYDGERQEIDVRGWIEDWHRSVTTALTASYRLGARYVVVRYEDLVRETEPQLARMCAAASLEYDPRMLTMSDFAESENSSFAGEGGRYRGKIREQDGVRRADRIPAHELARVTSACRQLAEAVGYDVADESAVRPLPPQPAVARLRLASSRRAAGSLVSRARARMTG